MFGFGIWELVLILVIVLLIFGAKRLPELGEFVGKTVRQIRGHHDDDTKKDESKDKK